MGNLTGIGEGEGLWPRGASYDPSSEEPFNVLRMEIGDTDPGWVLLTDAELKAILKRSKDNLDDAILRSLVIIIAKLGGYTDETVGSISLQLSQRLQAYKDLYAMFRARQGVDFGLASGMPYAGGISRVDNAAIDADSDRAPLYFGKRQIGPQPRDTFLEREEQFFGAGSGHTPDYEDR